MMNARRRGLALSVTTVALGVALATPASADVDDAVYYTTHMSGYVYDYCEWARQYYGPVQGTEACATYTASQPLRIVGELQK